MSDYELYTVCPICPNALTPDPCPVCNNTGFSKAGINTKQVDGLKALNAELKRLKDAYLKSSSTAHAELDNLKEQLAQAEAVQRVLARECEKYDNGKRVLTQWTDQLFMQWAKEQVHETSVSADKEEQS